MKKLLWAAALLPSVAVAKDLNWWKPFSAVDAGDTAWVMMSAALVLFIMMLPGLALF